MSCTGVRNNLKQFKKIHYQYYSLSSQLLFQSCRECILLITTRMLFAKFCLKRKIVDTTNKLIDWYHLDFWTFTGIPCKNYPLIKLKKKAKQTTTKNTPKQYHKYCSPVGQRKYYWQHFHLVQMTLPLLLFCVDSFSLQSSGIRR